MALYPFITFADGLQVLHSDIYEEDGVEKMFIHFERPTVYGFDEGRIILPTYQWEYHRNFSDKEIEELETMVRQNAHIFYTYARLGGIESCLTYSS